jgi:hypothetical protein
VREVAAEGDTGRCGFDEFAGARAIKHAGLGSHDGSSLYTGGERKEVESREWKDGKKEKITQRRGESQSYAENLWKNSP